MAVAYIVNGPYYSPVQTQPPDEDLPFNATSQRFLKIGKELENLKKSFIGEKEKGSQD